MTKSTLPDKTIFYFPLLFLGFWLILVTQSCTNPCVGVDCENGGFCVEGNCHCEFPFEGAECTDPVSRRFAGIFSGGGNCDSSGIDILNLGVVTSQIDSSISPQELRICTFISEDSCLNVFPARLTGNHSFAIPRSLIPIGNGELAYIFGFGIISQSLDTLRLSFDLVTPTGAQTAHCNPVLVRTQ